LDTAFEWLERAYEQRDPPLGLIQFHIGILSGLGSDPRHKLLLRKMNFPDRRTSGRFAAGNLLGELQVPAASRPSLPSLYFLSRA
jgi:hypothetical protein